MDGSSLVRIVETELSKRSIPKAKFYKDTGISSATFSQWRNGVYQPTDDKVATIEEYLSIDLADYEKADRDSETDEVLQWLREDYSHRALFESARGLSRADALAAASYIEKLKAGEI